MRPCLKALNLNKKVYPYIMSMIDFNGYFEF